MAKLGDATNHPSSHPKNTIQGLQSDLREATMERGAMVDMIDYEGMDQLKVAVEEEERERETTRSWRKW